MLGAVSVAIAATVLELLSGSVRAAASDAAAIETVLTAGAVLALAGALSLLIFGRGSAPPIPIEAKASRVS